MFYLIKNDVKAYARDGKAYSIIRTVLFEHAFHLVFFIRIGSLIRRIPVLGNFFGIILEYFIRIVFSSDINCNAKIGPGLFIIHGHDIVIGAKTIIGINCKIFNGVTLGNKNTEIENDGQPVIGNNVVISTGAKILGPITIGDNCIIGANSVVIKSFGPDSIIGGIPAKILKSRLI
jgi:serine O-acetyltransferase